MPKAYSYIRISSTKQVLGRGQDRQFENTQAYCAERGLELVGSMRDTGLSGFHGDHRKRGALGVFLDMVRKKEIERGSFFICEHLDRLSREGLSKACGQFLELINAGIVVVTLFDKREHTEASIDSGMGDLIMSVATMYGSNQESEKKSIRGKDVWKMRRHLPMSGMSNPPGWIIKMPDGKLKMDTAKQKIIERIATDFQTIGGMKLAKTLNQQNVPLVSKERSDGASAWSYNAVMRLIRGRTVRGEQMVNGQVVQAWPAAISETLWLAANHAADQRHDGGGGRKGASLTNIFGALAVCASCNTRMYVARGGTNNQTTYLCCGSALRGVCKSGRYHKLAPVENAIMQTIGTLAIAEAPSPPTALQDELTEAQAEADALATTYGRAFEKFGDAADGSLAAQNLEKLEQRHSAKLAEVAAIKKRLALVAIAKPATDHVATVQRLVAGLDGASDEDRYEARARISTALQALLGAVVFDPSGKVIVRLDKPPFSAAATRSIVLDMQPEEGAERLTTAADIMAALRAGKTVGMSAL